MVAANDIEQKLGEMRNKLHDYELKAKQIPHLKKEIEDLEEELEAHQFHNPKEGSPKPSPKRELQPAPMPPMTVPAEALEGEEAKKKMRGINKKLDQIKKLKEKEGADLDADAIAKINSERELLKEMECLKNGTPYESKDLDSKAKPHFKPLPDDPADVEKRIKALKKKLQQIEALKSKKKAELDTEAMAKLESERELKIELEALEKGDTKVDIPEPSLDEILEKQTSDKNELERRAKAIKKKLAQIDNLKKQGASSLDADGKAKLATEKNLGKELSQLEKSIGEINKKERDRVAERLG